MKKFLMKFNLFEIFMVVLIHYLFKNCRLSAFEITPRVYMHTAEHYLKLFVGNGLKVYGSLLDFFPATIQYRVY
jgi:hypothetical protein